MNRKLLSVIMSVALLFGSFGMAFGADVTTSAASDFFDMPDNWSTAALNKAVENGLLTGYAEGGKKLIKAGNSLTRAEMAAVVNRAFASVKMADLSGVNDVSPSAWYAKDMAKAVKMGTFSYDTKMRPGDKITRQEAFTVLARAFKLVGTDAEHIALDVFSDKDEIAIWALNSLDGMVEAGYIQGSGGTLKPTANITRAEFATVMDNLVKDYFDVAGDVTEVVADGNVIVRTPGAVLKDVTIKGDLIIADGVGEGDVTLDNVKVEGRMVVRGGGIDSIIIKGGSDVGNVIVAKVEGEVRIYVEGGAEVEVIYVDDGSDDVIVEGTIGNLEVAGEGVTVYAKDADVNNATVSGDNSKIIVSDGSKVKNGNITGDSSAIVVDEGGSVDTVAVSGDNATVGGKPVEAGQTVDGSGEAVKPPSKPSRPSTPRISAISMTTDVIVGDETIEYYDLNALPYGAEVIVTLETATKDAKIYYTTDETDPNPDAEDGEYKTSFKVVADADSEEAVIKTIKVLATKDGYRNMTGEFTIKFKPKYFTLDFKITVVNAEGNEIVSATEEGVTPMIKVMQYMGQEEEASTIEPLDDGKYELETDKWCNYTIGTEGSDYSGVLGQVTGPEGIGNERTLEITLVKVNCPDSGYYSAGKDLKIIISRLRHEQSDVKVGLPIYTGGGWPWASGEPVLTNMEGVEEVQGGETVEVLWFIDDTSEAGVLTISGEVGEDLPYGIFSITLPDYGYTIDNAFILGNQGNIDYKDNVRLGAAVNLKGVPAVGHELDAIDLKPPEAVSESEQTINYQWQRSDDWDGDYENIDKATFEDISDATSSTYEIAKDDVYSWIRVKATSEKGDAYHWGSTWSDPVKIVPDIITPVSGTIIRIGEEIKVYTVGADDLHIMLWAGEIGNVGEAQEEAVVDGYLNDPEVNNVLATKVDMVDGSVVFTITINEGLIEELEKQNDWTAGKETTWVITPADMDWGNDSGTLWTEYDAEGSKAETTFFVYRIGGEE